MCVRERERVCVCLLYKQGKRGHVGMIFNPAFEFHRRLPYKLLDNYLSSLTLIDYITYVCTTVFVLFFAVVHRTIRTPAHVGLHPLLSWLLLVRSMFPL